MKYNLFGLFVVALSLTIVGCDTAKLNEANEKIALLESELAEFSGDKDLIKGEYNEVIETLNDIDLTLMEIDTREKEMENLIGDLSGKELQRELILSKITTLKDENRKAQAKARELQRKLNEANKNTENKALKKIIAQSEVKLKAKDEEIKNYEILVGQIQGKLQYTKDELATQYGIVTQQKDALEFKNKELMQTNSKLENTVKDLESSEKTVAECARAYLAIDTKKALKKSGILKKVGTKLDGEYQTILRKVTPVNFYETTVIETEGEIEEILPERDAASYAISGNKLTIKDLNVFWQTRDAVVILK